MLKKFKLTKENITLYVYRFLFMFLLLVLVFITNSYDVKKKYT